MNTYDLEIYKGSTFSLNLTLKDGDGVPIDLTNYAISGFLKSKYSDTAKLADLNPVVIAPSESGNISLSIPSTTTAGLPVTLGVYDIQIFHNTSGTTTNVLNGKATIYPEVTY